MKTTIVNKIILGITDWTAEELQYQINNPQEIEKALSIIQKEMQSENPECCEVQSGIVIVPSYLNILQRKEAKIKHEKKNGKCRRILSAPTAVALAIYANQKNIDLLKTAIVILENNKIDIAIFEIEDGVFEVKCAGGCSQLENNTNKITEVCSKAITDSCWVLVDELIIVGKGAYIAENQHAVEKAFGKTARKMSNLAELQAKGADIQNDILTGKVTNVLPLDVISLPIGIEAGDGTMSEIISANCITPTKKIQTFTTNLDNQSSMEIHVLQGEKPLAKNNVTIGRFLLDGIPPAPRGLSQIEVTFDIDANGVLKVSAKDKETGKEIKIKESTADR